MSSNSGEILSPEGCPGASGLAAGPRSVAGSDRVLGLGFSVYLRFSVDGGQAGKAVLLGSSGTAAKSC